MPVSLISLSLTSGLLLRHFHYLLLSEFFLLAFIACPHEMDFSEYLMSIARAGAGVNNIPLDECADQGIAVFNTPGANANAVKELTLAGLFLSARNIPAALSWAQTLTTDVSKAVEKGKSQFAGHEIEGKTLGVVGLGAIGVLVANSAASLGMCQIKTC